MTLRSSNCQPNHKSWFKDYAMLSLQDRHGDESHNLLKLLNWRRSRSMQIHRYYAYAVWLTHVFLFVLSSTLNIFSAIFRHSNTLSSFWSGHIVSQFSSLADKEIPTYHTTWQGYEKTFSSNTFWCMCCTCCNCCTCAYCTCSTCS